jgi:hypothetical protein
VGAHILAGRAGAEVSTRSLDLSGDSVRDAAGLIVETGTAAGGSALFLASICELLGHGNVVTIDVAEGERPPHPRISYLHGSSTDAVIVAQVQRMAAGAEGVMLCSTPITPASTCSPSSKRTGRS